MPSAAAGLFDRLTGVVAEEAEVELVVHRQHDRDSSDQPDDETEETAAHPELPVGASCHYTVLPPRRDGG